MEKREPKFLKYDELPDVPKQQIQEHYAIYEDMVREFNELHDESHDKHRLLNMIRLHESYFDSIGGTGRVGGHIIDLIEQDFGSVDDWERQFREMAEQASEWLVLAYDMEDNKLRFIFCGDRQALWNCIALIVFDAHEHAYARLDDKASYIEAFMKNLDWEYVNTLLGKFGIR